MVGNAATDVVFVFPGQGSQWIGMGQTPCGKNRCLKQRFRRDRAIQAEAGFSVIEALTAEDAGAKLEQIEIVQRRCLLFLLHSLLVARLWNRALFVGTQHGKSPPRMSLRRFRWRMPSL